MKIRRVYLSGAITGTPGARAQFSDEARFYRKAGYEVFNPMEHQEEDPTKSHYDYMREDLAELVKCDAIAFVNDTSRSKGAFVERMVALACGIEEI